MRASRSYAARHGDLEPVASVASFFLSRIDTAIDALVAARLQERPNANEASALRSLMGKVAIANAKLVYQRYQELFSGPRWQALAGRGAQTQRLLWASTGTKNPSYRDVVYIEELIGPGYRHHDPSRNLRGFSRPRPAARKPCGGCGGRRRYNGHAWRGRDLHEGGHRQAPR